MAPVQCSCIDDRQAIKTSHHTVMGVTVDDKPVATFEHESQESLVGLQDIALIVRPHTAHIVFSEAVA